MCLQENLKPEDEERSTSLREQHALCVSLCHTATAYQVEGDDLDGANQACEEAAKLIAKADKSGEHNTEDLTIIKLDLLFRQLEVSKP